MMTYKPNHGIQILDLTHLRIALQIIHKILMISNTYLLKYLKITTLPPPNFQKVVGGGPVEQSTEPEEENHDDIQQEIQDETPEVSQKTPKENTPETQIQKTPENSQNTPSQEQPINTRGEKYNLRPNPNPNYSDSYRY